MRKVNKDDNNKIIQSNLKTGRVATNACPHAPLKSAAPTVHAFSQLRRTFAPKIAPPMTDPQTQLPASSLDPPDLPSISDQPFCHNECTGQTNTHQLNRWLKGTFDNCRPLSLY